MFKRFMNFLHSDSSRTLADTKADANPLLYQRLHTHTRVKTDVVLSLLYHISKRWSNQDCLTGFEMDKALHQENEPDGLFLAFFITVTYSDCPIYPGHQQMMVSEYGINVLHHRRL